MAASYFGKFDSQMAAQQAIDQGKLLKPFVAMWEDTLHYDDLDETEEGYVDSITEWDVNGQESTNYLDVVGNGMYWQILPQEDWITTNYSGIFNGSATVDFTVHKNEGESRSGKLNVVFYYDANGEYERNTVVITINQAEVEPVSEGSVDPTSTAVTYDTSAAYFNVTHEDGLPWEVVSNDENPWYNFNPSGIGSQQNYEVYLNSNNWLARSASLTFKFYDQGMSLINTVDVDIEQSGTTECMVSLSPDQYLESPIVSGYGGDLTGYIINRNGMDYDVLIDGDQVITGGTGDTFTISYPENITPRTKQFQIACIFDNAGSPDYHYLYPIQEGNSLAPTIEMDTLDTVLSGGRTGTLDIACPVDETPSWSYWKLEGSKTNDGKFYFNGTNYWITGNTSESVAYEIFENTGNTEATATATLTCYDSNDNVVYTDQVNIQQFYDGELEDESVNFKLTFETDSDNQQVRIFNNSGTKDYFKAVVIDGIGNIKSDIDEYGCYTLATAGTYEINCYPVDTVNNIAYQGQPWFTNSDVISVEILPSELGTYTALTLTFDATFMSLINGCSKLESVSFPAYMTLNAGNALFGYSKMNNLTTLYFYQPTCPTFNPNGSFNALPQTGTVHIPSGADYSLLAGKLPQWTIVDDL